MTRGAAATLLLTGFEPFDVPRGGDRLNPSAEIARALDATQLEGARVASLVLPVARARIETPLRAALERLAPAAVVGLGLASDRHCLCVEQVAVNLDDYELADADGARPRGEKIDANGPDALLATLPVPRLVQAVREAGVPAAVSRSAGTYLCNHLFYRLLQWGAAGRVPRAAFVHLPSLPECVAERGEARPSMALETQTRGVSALLAEVVRSLR